MPLTLEQQRRFEDWYTDRVAQKDCPCCGVNDWTITGEPLYLPAVAGRGSGLPHQSDAGVIAQLCNNCAHIRLFGTTLIGIG
jgi:hypothetical protein